MAITPLISSAPPADGKLGVTYTHIFTFNTGASIPVLSIAGGLPDGLSFNADTATITGTPKNIDSFVFSLVVEVGNTITVHPYKIQVRSTIPSPEPVDMRTQFGPLRFADTASQVISYLKPLFPLATVADKLPEDENLNEADKTFIVVRTGIGSQREWVQDVPIHVYVYNASSWEAMDIALDIESYMNDRDSYFAMGAGKTFGSSSTQTPPFDLQGEDDVELAIVGATYTIVKRPFNKPVSLTPDQLNNSLIANVDNTYVAIVDYLYYNPSANVSELEMLIRITNGNQVEITRAGDTVSIVGTQPMTGFTYTRSVVADYSYINSIIDSDLNNNIAVLTAASTSNPFITIDQMEALLVRTSNNEVELARIDNTVTIIVSNTQSSYVASDNFTITFSGIEATIDADFELARSLLISEVAANPFITIDLLRAVMPVSDNIITIEKIDYWVISLNVSSPVVPYQRDEELTLAPSDGNEFIINSIEADKTASRDIIIDATTVNPAITANELRELITLSGNNTIGIDIYGKGVSFYVGNPSTGYMAYDYYTIPYTPEELIIVSRLYDEVAYQVSQLSSIAQSNADITIQELEAAIVILYPLNEVQLSLGGKKVYVSVTNPAVSEVAYGDFTVPLNASEQVIAANMQLDLNDTITAIQAYSVNVPRPDISELYSLTVSNYQTDYVFSQYGRELYITATSWNLQGFELQGHLSLPLSEEEQAIVDALIVNIEENLVRVYDASVLNPYATQQDLEAVIVMEAGNRLSLNLNGKEATISGYNDYLLEVSESRTVTLYSSPEQLIIKSLHDDVDYNATLLYNAIWADPSLTVEELKSQAVLSGDNFMTLTREGLNFVMVIANNAVDETVGRMFEGPEIPPSTIRSYTVGINREAPSDLQLVRVDFADGIIIPTENLKLEWWEAENPDNIGEATFYFGGETQSDFSQWYPEMQRNGVISNNVYGISSWSFQQTKTMIPTGSTNLVIRFTAEGYLFDDNIITAYNVQVGPMSTYPGGNGAEELGWNTFASTLPDMDSIPGNFIDGTRRYTFRVPNNPTAYINGLSLIPNVPIDGPALRVRIESWKEDEPDIKQVWDSTVDYFAGQNYYHYVFTTSNGLFSEKNLAGTVGYISLEEPGSVNPLTGLNTYQGNLVYRVYLDERISVATMNIADWGDSLAPFVLTRPDTE